MISESTKQRLFQVSRFVWLGLVVGFAVTYWRRELSLTGPRWSELSWYQLLQSISSLLLAKLLLAESARWSMTGSGVRFSLWHMLGLYSVSQLGKYLPGGVWHFLGRAALYREHGFRAKTSARVILVENFWLLSSALCLGVAAGWPGWIERWVGHCGGVGRWGIAVWTTGGVATILVLWLVVLFGGSRALLGPVRRAHRPVLRVASCQVAIWCLLGLSFWSLAPHSEPVYATFPAAVSSFAIGWAIGYLAPFAPAGVGVREAAIAILLTPATPLADAVVAVSLSRLVWTATELVLGLLGHLSLRSTSPVAAG